ncbi:MAG: 3'(2'),5'-bisphosphate nucleotidase CysQ [Bacteroidia bacterium]|nr:3'(2'),5'-bisphosphate nucleotidase CysQ [Bacteroidia bacterium]
MDYSKLLPIAIEAAMKGAEKIMQVYAATTEVTLKEDKSPLTQADTMAHNAIKDILASTDLPLLSEEGSKIEYDTRKNWEYFWMVDPLDGTKEFIKKNGEFTVNIALIKNGEPVFGVIYAPVLETLFYGYDGLGSYKMQVTNHKVDFSTTEDLVSNSTKLPENKNRDSYIIVASRSHFNEETEKFVAKAKEKHNNIDFISKGSSLKICLVADGSADVYPRLAPTMEWDTAAGHAIAEFAGKQVIDHKTGKKMQYNKENLLNNWFVVE